MYDPERTRNRALDVACKEIQVLCLSSDGLLPRRSRKDYVAPSPRRHASRHLPPSNLLEETLLSIWINTHQAMFVATGISAHCIHKAIGCMDADGEPRQIRQQIGLAIDCRLASAVYTSMPFLTKELYEAYVRESMMLVHPGFSGVSNLEAIVMETSLRAIKKAHGDLAVRNRSLSEALTPDIEALFAADKEWWRWHGRAMVRYVETPVSLAKQDFKNQKASGSGDRSFEDYRERVLRQDGALEDYDRYFAVERRGDLCLQHYRHVLAQALENSAGYIEKTGVLAEYRIRGTQAQHDIIDAEIAACG